MAFRSVEEFLQMYREDPEKASKFLQKAATEGKDPINPSNSGYSAAVQRRMKKNRKKPNKYGLQLERGYYQ